MRWNSFRRSTLITKFAVDPEQLESLVAHVSAYTSLSLDRHAVLKDRDTASLKHDTLAYNLADPKHDVLNHPITTAFVSDGRVSEKWEWSEARSIHLCLWPKLTKYLAHLLCPINPYDSDNIIDRLCRGLLVRASRSSHCYHIFIRINIILSSHPDRALLSIWR